MAQNPSNVARQVSTLSILWGVLLICLGIVAVGEPMIAAIAVNVVISWLLVLAGVVHLIVAFHTREFGSLLWRFLVGLAYLCFGAYLIGHPAIGVASLTLVLASLFLVEGIFNVVMFFRIPKAVRSSWVLFDGIVTLILGLMIYMQWPTSSAWAIGTLVGVSLIFSGLTRVMVSLAVRRATTEIATKLAA
jgi:uncharacterized membrane protein HdeD (DUF308 family)